MSKNCVEACRLAAWCESRIILAHELGELTLSEAAQRRSRQVGEWPETFVAEVSDQSCLPDFDCTAAESIAKRVVRAQMAADTDTAR